MHKAKVSIVVPVYNTEEYLNACIWSVLNQTYDCWELILVNDGSSDSSESICRSFSLQDERILLISQENQGVSAARNTGIAKATGKYIVFLDSDDELEVNAVEIMVSDIIQYGADISSASESVIKANGSVRCVDGEGSIVIYEGDDMIKRSLSYAEHTHSLHAQLFDMDFIRGISFAEGHHINEDGYFLFECYKKKPRVIQHNVSIYRYYFRENSSTKGGFSDKYFDMLYFCNQKFKYIQDNMPHLLNEAKNMVVRTHLLFLQVLCRTNEKRYKSVEKESVKAVRKWRRYYRPINRHHRLLAWTVFCGFFPLYKKIIRYKYY